MEKHNGYEKKEPHPANGQLFGPEEGHDGRTLYRRWTRWKNTEQKMGKNWKDKKK